MTPKEFPELTGETVGGTIGRAPDAGKFGTQGYAAAEAVGRLRD